MNFSNLSIFILYIFIVFTNTQEPTSSTPRSRDQSVKKGNLAYFRTTRLNCNSSKLVTFNITCSLRPISRFISRVYFEVNFKKPIKFFFADLDISFKGFLDQNFHTIVSIKKADFCHAVKHPPPLPQVKIIFEDSKLYYGFEIHECPYEFIKINATAGFGYDFHDRREFWQRAIVPNGYYRVQAKLYNARDSNILSAAWLNEYKVRLNDDKF